MAEVDASRFPLLTGDSSGCFQSCCSPCTSCCGTMNSQKGRLRLEEDGQHVSENDDTITTKQPRWSDQETLRNWK